MEIITKCEMCGKDMVRKWPRKYCSTCRRLRDKELRDAHNPVYNKISKEKRKTFKY